MRAALAVIATFLLMFAGACVDRDNAGGGTAAVQDQTAGQAESGQAQEQASGNEQPCDAQASTEEPADAVSGTENPCEQHGSVGEVQRLRGTVTATGTAYFFTACDSEDELSINDNPDQQFMRAAPDIVGPDGKFYAIMDVSMGEATLNLERLWHAAPLGDTHGCEEDLSAVIYKAAGNEPFWGITVYDDGLLTLSTPEGSSSLRVTDTFTDENFVNITAIPDSPGDEITMEFASSDCSDTMSGAYSSMIATVIHGELMYGGCAWVGEAMGLVEGE